MLIARRHVGGPAHFDANPRRPLTDWRGSGTSA